MALSIAKPVTANQGKTPFILVLDAGHGGKDPGTISRNAQEKKITLAITLLTGKYIAEKHPDVKIVYTRKTDVFIGLKERANIANKSKANLFISIHTNADKTSSPCGVEVYAFGTKRAAENFQVVQRENEVIKLEDNYMEKYEGFDPNSTESYIIFQFMQNKFLEQSLDLATIVVNEIKTCVPWKDRGVKQDAFAVLRETSMPSILIELDFISNPEARKILISETGQQQYAHAICKAFTQYKNAYDQKNATIEKTETPAEPVKQSTSGKSVYKIQIMAGSNYVPNKSSDFKGYRVEYFIENNLYKYTYGESSDLAKIRTLLKSVRKDFKDAFIVRFENGVKVATIY
ncbi:MAG: N-acetylmuramoyl-L-alanine amidase [Candidatus Symbiothrix sp.]|nr:N-acetylmuramoyl-L-alanine amidase [Candidatus Symbiothrix sp.]